MGQNVTPDGSVVITVDLDDQKAQRELNRLSRRIETLNLQIERKTRKRDYLTERATEVRAEYESALDNEQDLKAQELAKEYSRIQTTIDRINEQLREHEEELGVATERAGELAAQLSAEPIEEVGEEISEVGEEIAEVGEEISEVGDDISEVGDDISEVGDDISEVGDEVAEVGEEVAEVGDEMAEAGDETADAGEAIEEIGEEAEESAVQVRHLQISLTGVTGTLAKLQRRLTGMVKRVFFFSVFTMALRGVRKWLTEAVKGDEEAAAAFERLKNAAVNLAQPLLDVLIPALTKLADVLTHVLLTISNGLGIAQEAQDLKNLGKAAKTAGGQLASFDTINKLSDKNAESSSGGTTAGGGDVAAGMEDKIAAALLLGGIALVGLGAAMRNLSLVLAGLALLGAGVAYAEGSGVADDWAAALGFDRVEEMVTAALLLAGMALLVIGILTHNILMALTGIGMLGVGVKYGADNGVLADWAEALGLNNVFDYVTAAIQLAGIAVIALGAKLQNIGLVIAGVVVLGIGIAADSIGQETLEDWWETMGLTSVQQWVGVALMLGGIALVAIGACMQNLFMVLGGLAMIGVATITNTENGNLESWVKTLGLEKVVGWVTAALLLGGIALIAFGAFTANIVAVLAGVGMLGAGISIGITSGTFMQWLDTIDKALEPVMGWVVLGLLVAGIGLVVAGLVMFNIPMLLAGLGLLGAGVSLGMTTGTFDEWLKVIGKAFSDFGDLILDVWDDLWEGTKTAINGILGFIEGLANGVVNGINTVIDALNGLSFTVPNWVPGIGGATFGFDIPKLSRVSIPRLAEGAVIPPNREFLAVLGDQKAGTNVEAPLDTIVAAFRQVLAESNDGTVNLYLDGDLLARSTITRINRAARAGGKLVIV